MKFQALYRGGVRVYEFTPSVDVTIGGNPDIKPAIVESVSSVIVRKTSLPQTAPTPSDTHFLGETDPMLCRSLGANPESSLIVHTGAPQGNVTQFHSQEILNGTFFVVNCSGDKKTRDVAVMIIIYRTLTESARRSILTAVTDELRMNAGATAEQPSLTPLIVVCTQHNCIDPVTQACENTPLGSLVRQEVRAAMRHVQK